MLQAAEVREAQRRAEKQLTKAIRHNEQLSAEAESLRADVTSLTTQLHRSTQDYTTIAQSITRLQAERDELTVKLATTNGLLEAALRHVADLMGRLNLPLALKNRAK